MTHKTLQRILYVEDDKDIQTIASLAIEDVGGLTLLVCSTGMEALEKAPSYKPDLILLDVMMPEMDGPKTFAKLSAIEETSKTPVIFITAKAQSSEIEKLISLGAIAVITKPFDPMKLSEQILSIWEKIQS